MNEQSLKAKLKQLAQVRQKTFQELWKTLALERFLARLAKSNLDDKLVFKGGFLLVQFIDIGRETIDLDFLARNFKVEKENILLLIQKICDINLADGFSFEIFKVSELEHFHMDYPGLRLSIKVSFYSMRDHIQLDIGVGDFVESIEFHMPLTGLNTNAFFESEITLQTYPIEFIFAEKLETVISRGAINSRMKDYHDLLLIIRHYDLTNREHLNDVIQKTFTHRNTILNLPIVFFESDIKQLQVYWQKHLRGLGDVGITLMLPSHIQQLIQEINDKLLANNHSKIL